MIFNFGSFSHFKKKNWKFQKFRNFWNFRNEIISNVWNFRSFLEKIHFENFIFIQSFEISGIFHFESLVFFQSFEISNFFCIITFRKFPILQNIRKWGWKTEMEIFSRILYKLNKGKIIFKKIGGVGGKNVGGGGGGGVRGTKPK